VTGPVIVQVGSKSSIGLIFTLLTAPAIAPPPSPPSAPPPAPPPSNPPPTSGLSIRVVGNKLVNGSGQTIRLLGVNRSGAEYACVQGWGMFDGPVDAAAVQAIKNWNVNAVRLPMNEDCWLGINGVSPTYAGANYQNAIANFVTLLHQAGIYVLLELQWNAPGTTLATNIGYMADRDHALDFWTSVANFFKNDPAVLFDLFNEPHDISDACWRDGCTTPGGWQAVGMQTMINTIRATGATQPIVVSANGWGNGGIPTYMSYKPSDPLNSLVASAHIYDFTNCTNQSCWDTYLKPMAAAMPLISGEMGETDCAQSFVNTFMNWLDSVGAGYLAWAWVASDCRAFPSLITDYSGTPTAYGVGVRAHLLTQTVENRNLETPTLLAQEPFTGADLGAPLNPIMSSLQVNTALSALADPSLELGFAEMPRSNLLAQEPFAGADLGTPLNPIVSPLQINTAVSALARANLKPGFAEMPPLNSTDRLADFLETFPYLLPRTLRSGRTRRSCAVRS